MLAHHRVCNPKDGQESGGITEACSRWLRQETRNQQRASWTNDVTG
jgi:hypothetical protein